MKIFTIKTKVMAFGDKDLVRIKIIIKGQITQQVNNFLWGFILAMIRNLIFVLS